MTIQMIPQESPAGGQPSFHPPVTATPSEADGNQPAGGTIIASTTSGAHFLRTYMPKCMVPKCGAAGTVELVSRYAKDAQVFCFDHGLDRLDALDYGKRGAA